MSAIRILTEFYRTPWALLPDTLAAMQAVLHRWAAGVRLGEAEIAAAIGDAPAAAAARRERTQVAQASMIGVLPISGVIGHRASLVADSSSGVGTSTEIVSAQFRQMLADPAVGAIILDVDSPGGSVFGTGELADEIFAARGTKPIVASVNSMAASAAYWIASAADEVVVTPGGVAGSIGVWMAHDDVSRMLEAEGVTRTVISAGKYKVEGHPWGPLTDEARAAMQADTDAYYRAFVKAVARNRNDTQTAVREGYGEGRTLLAESAVKAKLADRIGTFDSVVEDLRARVRKGNAGSAASRAHAERRLQLAQHE